MFIADILRTAVPFGFFCPVLFTDFGQNMLELKKSKSHL